MHWVLLITIYSGNISEVKRPAFFATQEACQATLERLQVRHKRVDGGCFDMSDPRIRNYVIDELGTRSTSRY